MTRAVNKYRLSLLLAVLLVAGCVIGPPAPEKKVTGPADSLIKLKVRDIPQFADDMDTDSLKAAIGQSLHYYGKLPKNRILRFGPDHRSVGDAVDSLNAILDILKKEGGKRKLNHMIRSRFDVYQPPPVGREDRPVLFTGYYEPVMDGSLHKTETYKYPIYKKPGDLIILDLAAFHPRFKGKKLTGRVKNGTFLPYYDREAIDTGNALSGAGLELAWLADPLDLFFLHIQGSGKIRLRGGGLMNVNYAASNGRVYRSIGGLLIREKKIAREKVSLRSIKEYLRANPGDRERILNYNESYVFFRQVPEGPIGAISEPLTAGRSIATDSALFPKGALAYIETETPVLNEEGRLKGWKKVSRFVLNQDTGGTIKGPGRVDLFFGSGEEAGSGAGYMNRNGRLYFLMGTDKKKLFHKHP